MHFDQNYSDATLQCCECSDQFIFSADDQQYYAQKGYTQPKRCPICRANRKAAMPSNNRRGGGNFNRPSRPQFSVKCSACGVTTTVPFEPSNDRPVYCSECYRNR